MSVVVEDTDYGWKREFHWGSSGVAAPRCRWTCRGERADKLRAFEVLANRNGVFLSGHLAVASVTALEDLRRVCELAARVSHQLARGVEPRDVIFA